jgi:putative Holliday junction resolvase
MTEPRRVMGIDYGEARIGIALSDPLGLVARPLLILQRRGRKADYAAIQAIIGDEQVAKVVVGLPTASDGGIGRQAQLVIRWARKLATALSCPIALWDESYSSLDAFETARNAVRRQDRRKPGEPVDDLAATVMLQEYLDAGGAEHEPGQPLESFAHIG